jgi:hypothetical protein
MKHSRRSKGLNHPHDVVDDSAERADREPADDQRQDHRRIRAQKFLSFSEVCHGNRPIAGFEYPGTHGH